jgi:hypothetical protein
MSRDSKLALLKAQYVQSLTEAVEANPNDYVWAGAVTGHKTPQEVADKMFATIQRGGIGMVTITNSDGWKRTCKALGIKQTYKAIDEWLES